MSYLNSPYRAGHADTCRSQSRSILLYHNVHFYILCVLSQKVSRNVKYVAQCQEEMIVDDVMQKLQIYRYHSPSRASKFEFVKILANVSSMLLSGM